MGILCMDLMLSNVNSNHGKIQIRSRKNSLVKCVIDHNVEDTGRESKCGFCVNWERSSEKSTYMRKAMENKICPEPPGSGIYIVNGIVVNVCLCDFPCET